MEKIKKKNDGERKEKGGRWRKKRKRMKEADDGNRVLKTRFPREFFDPPQLHTSWKSSL